MNSNTSKEERKGPAVEDPEDNEDMAEIYREYNRKYDELNNMMTKVMEKKRVIRDLNAMQSSLQGCFCPYPVVGYLNEEEAEIVRSARPEYYCEMWQYNNMSKVCVCCKKILTQMHYKACI